jgi:peptidoglycan hydrolase-like protein with peptidoglycan-binding domain
MRSEPTLREGDKSADGWVEFLQQLLYNHGALELEVDGDFGPKTRKAVIEFQQARELVDRSGVVGDETWSALRGDETLDTPGANDGATLVDRGVKLRFQDFCYYDDQRDILYLSAFSVGTEEPAEGSVEPFIHLKDPRGNEFDVTAIHSPQGDRHHSFVANDATKGHPDGDYSGVAQLPASTGNEIFAFTFNKVALIDI